MAVLARKLSSPVDSNGVDHGRHVLSVSAGRRMVSDFAGWSRRRYLRKRSLVMVNHGRSGWLVDWWRHGPDYFDDVLCDW